MGHSRFLCIIGRYASDVGVSSRDQRRLQNFDSVAILQIHGHWARDATGAEAQKAKSLGWGYTGKEGRPAR